MMGWLSTHCYIYTQWMNPRNAPNHLALHSPMSIIDASTHMSINVTNAQMYHANSNASNIDDEVKMSHRIISKRKKKNNEINGWMNLKKRKKERKF